MKWSNKKQQKTLVAALTSIISSTFLTASQLPGQSLCVCACAVGPTTLSSQPFRQADRLWHSVLAAVSARWWTVSQLKASQQVTQLVSQLLNWPTSRSHVGTWRRGSTSLAPVNTARSIVQRLICLCSNMKLNFYWNYKQMTALPSDYWGSARPLKIFHVTLCTILFTTESSVQNIFLLGTWPKIQLLQRRLRQASPHERLLYKPLLAKKKSRNS